MFENKILFYKQFLENDNLNKAYSNRNDLFDICLAECLTAKLNRGTEFSTKIIIVNIRLINTSFTE